MNHELRFGRFTSSEIGNLMMEGKTKGSFGAPALSYINEKNLERKLGRSLDKDFSSKPTSWGTLCEYRVFEKLGLSYTICSKETIVHPKVDYWSGTPDATKKMEGIKVVADVKCPFTMKSFCDMVDAWERGGINAVREVTVSYKKVGELFFWQIVSNACLTGASKGELIIYCPYKSELDEIRLMTESIDSPDQAQFGWVKWASDEELPFLMDGGYYQNLNVMPFDITPEMKSALHERVLEAGKELIELPKTVEA